MTTVAIRTRGGLSNILPSASRVAPSREFIGALARCGLAPDVLARHEALVSGSSVLADVTRTIRGGGSGGGAGVGWTPGDFDVYVPRKNTMSLLCSLMSENTDGKRWYASARQTPDGQNMAFPTGRPPIDVVHSMWELEPAVAFARDGALPVQLVVINDKFSPLGAVAEFDFTIVMHAFAPAVSADRFVVAGLDAAAGVTPESVLADVRDRVLRHNPASPQMSDPALGTTLWQKNLKRSVKYSLRGWTIAPTTLEHLERRTHEVARVEAERNGLFFEPEFDSGREHAWSRGRPCFVNSVDRNERLRASYDSCLKYLWLNEALARAGVKLGAPGSVPVLDAATGAVRFSVTRDAMFARPFETDAPPRYRVDGSRVVVYARDPSSSGGGRVRRLGVLSAGCFGSEYLVALASGERVHPGDPRSPFRLHPFFTDTKADRHVCA